MHRVDQKRKERLRRLLSCKGMTPSSDLGAPLGETRQSLCSQRRCRQKPVRAAPHPLTVRGKDPYRSAQPTSWGDTHQSPPRMQLQKPAAMCTLLWQQVW